MFKFNEEIATEKNYEFNLLVPNPTQVLKLRRLRRRYNFTKGTRQNETKTSE